MPKHYFITGTVVVFDDETIEDVVRDLEKFGPCEVDTYSEVDSAAA